MEIAEFYSFFRAIIVHYSKSLFPKVYWKRYREMRHQYKNSQARLRQLKGKHLNETIFCIGLGPSLKQQDLSRLNNQNVLLCNSAFQLLENFSPKSHYNVITDNSRFLQLRDVLSKRPEETFVACVPDRSEEGILKNDAGNFVYLMPAHVWVSEDYSIYPSASAFVQFSENISKRIFLGYTVIFSAIQIASYMGAQKIVLLGVDMNYTGDPNNDYAVPGVVTQQWLDYDSHIRPMFEHFYSELNNRGIELVNATAGGRVDCIPRVRLDEVIKG